MPSPNNVLTADSYIQDGLVFQLDGIEYGGIDGQWIDRKAHCSFDLRTYIQRNINSYQFNGPLGAPLLYGGLKGDGINYSAEIVIEHSANISCYLISGSVDFPFHFGLSAANGGRMWFGNQATVPYYLYSFGLNCVHFGSNCLINGVSQRFDRNGAWEQSDQLTLAAKNKTNNSYVFKNGSIYAIRIYNRQLTDREILINQNIDNARFQLGLDIPDEVLPATRSLSLFEPFALPDESMTEHEPTNET